MVNSLLEETKIISSINYDQHEILLDIMQLHCPDGFELDPTYNRGGFYRHAGIPRPKYCFDLTPLRPECQQADCRHLPLPDSSISTAILDPPFFATTQKSGKTGTMCNKYSYCESMVELRQLYRDCLQELSRVLVPMGILVFKCQDCVNGKQNQWMHVFVLNEAEKVGFRGIDLFIKINRSAPIPWNFVEQHHARKMHSYFWVLKKKRKTR